MSLNKVMLIGNVGKEPEIRYIEQGGSNTKVATFSLATTESYKDRDGNKHDNTEWHNIVAWRGTADIVEKYVRKGTQVYVEGKLRTRSWNDQSGNKRFVTEILAESLQLLGGKPQEGNAQEQRTSAPQRQAQPQAARRETVTQPVSPQAYAGFEPQEEDLPF